MTGNNIFILVWLISFVINFVLVRKITLPLENLRKERFSTPINDEFVSRINVVAGVIFGPMILFVNFIWFLYEGTVFLYRRSGNKKILLVLMIIFLITNVSSFSTVAMERYISRYSKEQAAVVNLLSSVPVLYEIGFHAGSRLFYKDNNFIETAKKEINL